MLRLAELQPLDDTDFRGSSFSDFTFHVAQLLTECPDTDVIA
jgi:hypothetical protein